MYQHYDEIRARMDEVRRTASSPAQLARLEVDRQRRSERRGHHVGAVVISVAVVATVSVGAAALDAVTDPAAEAAYAPAGGLQR